MAAAIIYANGQRDGKIDVLVEDGKKNIIDHTEIKKDLSDTKDEIIKANTEITKIAKDIEYIKKDGLLTIIVDPKKDIAKEKNN